MADEPETTTGQAPETLVERLEADIAEAQAAVAAAPAEVSAEVAKVHAEIDTFISNVTRNISSEIPTRAHNFLQSEVAALKARIVSLF